jgi:hypothetical protein
MLGADVPRSSSLGLAGYYCEVSVGRKAGMEPHLALQ